jgi:hypothetical protein
MSRVKTYEIKKGKHNHRGFNLGFTFSKEVCFRAKFDESCLYDLGNNDNYDINKLYGFSTTWSHHKQSARVGWRCIDGEKIQLLTYSYNNGVRSIDESDLLGEVEPNQWFRCEIHDLENYYFYKYRSYCDDGETAQFNTATDGKRQDWFLFHYLLYPYFGGNNPAPHDMKIYLEVCSL